MTFHFIRIKPSDLVWEHPGKIIRWCSRPYPGHPKGCPKTGHCEFYNHSLRKVFRKFERSNIHLAWIEFDLDAHATAMKAKHPGWTDRQCRNLLYWQNGIRKSLRTEVKSAFPGCFAIFNAEGAGINFYRMMNRFGIRLDRMNDLHKVRIIAIVIDMGLERFA